MQHGSPEAGKGWCVKHLSRTPLGDALLALLYTQFFENVNNIWAGEKGSGVPFGLFQPVLQPYWSERKNNLPLPSWTFREGTHIFKVSLGRTWRRISMPADQHLDVLAYTILDSFKFDHDHLFQFFLSFGREDANFIG